METISRSLKPADAVFCLAGLGGVGKSQTVRFYAQHHRTAYALVWWCEAETDAQLMMSLRALANELVEQRRRQPEGALLTEDWSLTGLSENQFIMQLFSHLGRISNWLLILDNLDDQALLDKYLPDIQAIASRLAHHVLLTSRNKTFRQLQDTTLKLSPFTNQADALRLLQQYVKFNPALRRLDPWSQDELALAKALAEKLGYLPLALNQAGAYLRANPSTSLQEYLELFQDEHEALWDDQDEVSKLDDYPESVRTTWLLNLQAVRTAMPEAGYVLDTLAYLSPDVIPKWLVGGLLQDREGRELLLSILANQQRRQGLGAIDDSDYHQLLQRAHEIDVNSGPKANLLFNRALRLLNQYSLVHYDASRFSLTLHRLVQLVQADRHWLSTRKIILWRLGLQLDALFEAKQPTPTLSEQREDDMAVHIEQLLAHIERCLVSDTWSREHEQLAGVAINLYLRLSNHYFHHSDSESGRQVCERAKALCEQLHETQTSRYATILGNLALTVGNLGDTERQRELLERALGIQEFQYGSDHWQVAVTLNNLANAIGTLGDTERERELLERALGIQESPLWIRSLAGCDHAK